MKQGILPYIVYALLGYVSGSLLFAWIIPKYLLHMDITQKPGDHNPGTFNVFAQAGAAAGILVLVLELAKGALPVLAASRVLPVNRWGFGLVMAAPVLGHAFPFWRIKGGGKAIAVSFGVLLGLWPNLHPLGLLVLCYLFFSLVVVVEPHLHRSILTYGCVALLTLLLLPRGGITLGVLLVSGIVILRHGMQYQGEKFSVHLGLKSEKQADAPEKHRET